MRKVIFLFLAILIGFGYSEAFAFDYTFRSTPKSDSKNRGYWYSVSVTCYDSDNNWVKLLTGYNDRAEPTQEERPDIFSCLGGLKLPPAGTPCKEWEVLPETFKGFYDKPPKSKILQYYMAPLLATNNLPWYFHSVVRVHKKGYAYGAAVMCYRGRWNKVVTGYENNPKPTEENFPEIFQTLEEFQLPQERNNCEEWEVWKNQYRGFYIE